MPSAIQEKHKRFCEELLACKVTPWEQGFLEDVLKRGWDLTVGQLNTLMPMVIKYLEGGDPKSYKPPMEKGDWKVEKTQQGYFLHHLDKPVGVSLSMKEAIICMNWVADSAQDIADAMGGEDLPFGEPEEEVTIKDERSAPAPF